MTGRSGGTVAAVDLGATSGRVMIGHVAHDELSVRPIARFPNGPVTEADGLHWDVTAIYEHALKKKCTRYTIPARYQTLTLLWMKL